MNISKQLQLRIAYEHYEKDMKSDYDAQHDQLMNMKEELAELNRLMRKHDYKGNYAKDALHKRNYILRKMMSFLIPQDLRIFVRRKRELKELLKEFDAICRVNNHQGTLQAYTSRYLSVNEQIDLMKTTGWTFEERGHDKIEFIN